MSPRNLEGSRSAVALFVGLSLASFLLVAGSAEAAAYKGKTKGGHSIAFNLKGAKAKKIRSLVPTICLETTGSFSSKSGAELFQPVAPGRIGRTVKSKALQPAAMNRGIEATKNYEVKLKRKGRVVSGKLKLNFSYMVPDLYQPRIYICSGSSTFTARPR